MSISERELTLGQADDSIERQLLKIDDRLALLSIESPQSAYVIGVERYMADREHGSFVAHDSSLADLLVARGRESLENLALRLQVIAGAVIRAHLNDDEITNSVQDGR